MFAYAKALCFIEDAFRCICFLEVARHAKKNHVCSTAQDWQLIVETAAELHTVALSFEEACSQMASLYQIVICPRNNCDVMPWVETKLKAHVRFYKSVEKMIEVKYHSVIGFGVFWKGVSFKSNSQEVEFEYFDPAPHFVLPYDFFNTHPDYGMQHPIKTRFWDFESSKTYGEVILGLMALFNSVCPECKTIDVFRFPASNPNLHEIGYIRFVLLRPSCMKYGTEIAFPYRSDWFDSSEFPCIVCEQEPYSISWICDGLVDKDEILISFIESCCSNMKNSTILFQSIEWLIFELSDDTNLATLTDSDFDHLLPFIIALTSWILQCFPAAFHHLSSLLAGKLLHLRKSATVDHFDWEGFLKTLFPRYAALANDFQSVFRFYENPTDEYMNAYDAFVKHRQSAFELLCNRPRSFGSSSFSDDVEEAVLRKLFDLTEEDLQMSDFLHYCIASSWKIVTGLQKVHHRIRIVRLMFGLLSLTSTRPSYIEHSIFPDLQRIQKVTLQTVQSFVQSGIESSSLFPQHSLDFCPKLLCILSLPVLGSVLNEFALHNFGGTISFLVQKMQKSSVSNKISLHLRQAFCQLPSLSHDYENFYNTFMTDDKFFDTREAEVRENTLSNFIYWCISEPRLGTLWITRLAKFVELQSEVAFGRYDIDPLNLWTVLVYLCCILNKSVVQIGVEVFDIYEFTKTYVFNRLNAVLEWESQTSQREPDIHDVYFLTHVVYVLTDYCNFDISADCFQKNAVLFSRVIENLLKFMRSRIQHCYAECLCEIHRKLHLLFGLYEFKSI